MLRCSIEQLGLLAEAIAHREIVTFAYTDTHGEHTARRVEPYRQVHHLLRWYLLGRDLHRTDWRVFRLDRLSDPCRTGARYTPRPLPAGSALDYLRHGLHQAKQRVTLVIDAPVPRVLDALKHQDAEIEPCGTRRTRVTLWLDSRQWLNPPPGRPGRRLHAQRAGRVRGGVQSLRQAAPHRDLGIHAHPVAATLRGRYRRSLVGALPRDDAP